MSVAPRRLQAGIFRMAALVAAVSVAGSGILACSDGGSAERDGAGTGSAGAAATAERPVERIEFTSYTDLEPLLARFDYTPEAWRAGVREVPRIYLTNIPPRWRDRVADEVSVTAKKRIFFRMLAPLALHANELILQDRARIETLARRMAGGAALARADRTWLDRIAARYRVIADPQASVATDALDELLARVDAVPISLVLAQAAEESGWGTSRFAAEGNALFGQWTWGGEGIKPEGQREELGDHRIAAFETPLESVMAYLHNLNTHAAYAELRTRRAEMRRQGKRPTGHELAGTLQNYSERGQDYVTSLHRIMRVNRLDAADDAHLGDTPTIYLFPVGPGSE